MYHRLTSEQIQEVLDAVDRSAKSVEPQRRRITDRWSAFRANLRARARDNGDPMSKTQAAALLREQERRDRQDEEFDAGPILRQNDGGRDDPSPDEIKALAAEIRESWSEAERRTREVIPPVPWNLRTVRMAEMRT